MVYLSANRLLPSHLEGTSDLFNVEKNEDAEGPVIPNVNREDARPSVLENQREPRRVPLSLMSGEKKSQSTQTPASCIDRMYRNHAAQKIEQSLFYYADGTPLFCDGSDRLSESVVFAASDEEGDGNVEELSFAAHIQPGSPVPSQADMEILIARALLNPYQRIPHTVLGYENGRRAFIKIECLFDPRTKTCSIDLKGSQNIPASKLYFAKYLATQTAQNMLEFSTSCLPQYAYQHAATDESTDPIDYDRKVLDLIYEANPGLEEALNEADWTHDQILNFLNHTIRQEPDNPTSIFEQLPNTLRNLKKIISWEKEIIQDLLLKIITHSAPKAALAMAKLPQAIQALRKIDLPDENLLEIIQAVILNGNQNLHYVLEELPVAIQALLDDPIWQPKQIKKLLIQIAQSSYPSAHESYKHLGYGLAAVRQTSWSNTRKRDFITFVTQKTQSQASICYYRLRELIDLLNATDLDEDQKYTLLRVCIFHGAKSFNELVKFVTICLDQINQDNAKLYISGLRRFFKALNTHNFESVLTLINKNTPHICTTISSVGAAEALLNHLSLFALIMEKWPYAGFNILEGLFDAITRGYLDPPLTSHQDKILEFIKQTNGFNPAIFNAYLQAKDKPAFYTWLKTINQKIINDDLSLEDIAAIRKKYDSEYLLGIIQITSPVSGSSSTPKERQVALMEEMIASGGDMRLRDVPKVWRKKAMPFHIDTGTRKLKEGTIFDESKIMAHIISIIDRAKEYDQIPLIELAEKMGDFFMAPRGTPRATARESAFIILMTIMGQFEDVVERIASLQDNPYKLIIFLEHILGDKDGAAIILAKALDLLPDEIFHIQIEPRELSHPHRVAKTIKKTWDKTEVPEAVRRQSIANILAAFDPDEVREEIVEKHIEDPVLQELILQTAFNCPTHSKRKIIQDFLQYYLEAIKTEKDKYEYQVSHQLKMSIRPVKGPAYCLNGVTSGICTDQDVALWSNPNFKLFAIIDEDLGVAVGYIYGYEVIEGGKRYLTLPGINPSDEFVATVKPDILYNQMIDQMIDLARIANYDGLYIPTDNNLNSNHSDIRHAIRKRHRNIKKLKKIVHWNTWPDPYPFNEVFVVYEK